MRGIPLEVDSPETLAGMVKKENIRYTHFSRNPKIAAFLKDYGYVKEYGENGMMPAGTSSDIIVILKDMQRVRRSVGRDCWDGMDEGMFSKTKEMLDDMHKRKIDMADEIYVINVGGYIGDSTRSEIEYARETGKNH